MAALRESIDLIRTEYGEEVDLAHLPPDQPDIYDAIVKPTRLDVSDRIAGPDGLVAKKQPTKVLRPGYTGCADSPRPNCRANDKSISEAADGQRARDVSPSIFRAGARENSGGAALSGTIVRMAMVAAGFTGGEAEQLRRALSHKRSEQRMKEIEVKLRAGMTQNGIPHDAQDKIVQFISSSLCTDFRRATPPALLFWPMQAPS